MSAPNAITERPGDEVRDASVDLGERLQLEFQPRNDQDDRTCGDPSGPAEAGSSGADFIPGGGEMGALVRAFDWSTTSLGPVSAWPQSLKTSLCTMLNSRYPMFIWWGRDLIKFYNDGYVPMLGQRHPWAMGKKAWDVWADVWNEVGPQAEIVLKEGKSTWNEQLLLVMRRYGYTEETYFTFSYSPVFDDEGRVGGVFCAVTEDTQRVLSERRLRGLRQIAAQTVNARTAQEACRLSAAALGDQQKDVSFALIYLFEGEDSARLAGSIGLPDSTALAPECIRSGETSVAWKMDAVLQGRPLSLDKLEALQLPGGAWPEPSTTVMLLPLSKGGHERPRGFLVAGASPRREFDDKYREFFELLAGGVASAIANAEAHDEERRRAEALAELDRVKTAFFSNVSHEFRTPLTLLLGPLEELLTKKGVGLDAADWTQLDLAHRNSLRLLRLVNALLDFSRIEAGRSQAAYEPTDLAQLTGELASVFRSAIERAGMRLVIDCPPLPEPVYIDRDMWEKIVLNLLSNAFKFTFRGQITVSLRADGQQAELRIEDTGIGVPADQLPRLFERFHRVESARGRTHEGSGIGLALVQELAKLHGGIAVAQSVVGEGSTFSVRIPFGTAHLPPDRIGAQRALASTALKADAYVEEALQWLPRDTAPARPIDVSSSRAPGQHPTKRTVSGRILLADDNADMREYVHRLLNERYEVETVADGSAALSAILENPPDLVLTDIMMPGLDGFELLRAIRENSRTTALPVILLSARAGEESRVEGLERGADDYLVKPFTARELLARVRSHLEMAQVRKEAAARETQFLREVKSINERLQAALLASNTGTFHWDIRTNAVTWDENLDRLFGLHPGSSVRSLEQFVSRVHPDDRDAVIVAVERSAHQGADFDLEFRTILPDGSVRWILDKGKTYFDEQNAPTYMAGACIDITERKQAEQALRQSQLRLRTMAETVPEVLFTNRPDGACDYVSKRFYDYTGMRDGSAEGSGWTAAIHPDDLFRATACWKRCVSAGRTYEDEYRLRRRDGMYRWFRAHAIPLRLDGKIVEWFGVATDIHDLKEIQEQLERRTHDLERSNQELQRFAYVLSHDLQSPLRTIASMTQLLARQYTGALDADADELIAFVLDGVNRMNRLITDLLDYARMSDERPTTPMDAEALVNWAMMNLQAQIDESGAVITIDKPLPWVSADDQLARVFQNLIGNAIKYKGQQRPEIHISAQQKGDEAIFAVQDNGIGFDMKYADRIFGVFQRLHGENQYEGTGIGLAICKRLIERYGGRLWVESEPDRGSTFYFSIPMAASEFAAGVNGP